MIWRRIRQQLEEYLTEKQADDRTVLTWYHRQFWETAEALLTEGEKAHENMAAYFADVWKNQRKPLELFRGKKACYPNASRSVAQMPDFLGEKLNLRKYTELPYHLIRAGKWESSSQILCECNFLVNTIRFQGLKKLLDDFALYFAQFAPEGYDLQSADLVYVKFAREELFNARNSEKIAVAHKQKSVRKLMNQDQNILTKSDLMSICQLTEYSVEVKIVHDLLVVCGDIFRCRAQKNWPELPIQIIARLSPLWYNFKLIKQLVQQAIEWVDRSAERLLIPRYHCMEGLGSLLRTTVNQTLFIPGCKQSFD